jgi:hypothetical protein
MVSLVIGKQPNKTPQSAQHTALFRRVVLITSLAVQVLCPTNSALSKPEPASSVDLALRLGKAALWARLERLFRNLLFRFPFVTAR